jgi:hypothetical protein
LEADDETRTSEITILPDGRICLFGASRELLELLGDMDLGDPTLDQRLAYLRRLDAHSQKQPGSNEVQVGSAAPEEATR